MTAKGPLQDGGKLTSSSYKLRLTFPFHALSCRKIQETVDIIPSTPEPAEVRSKIRAFDVLTSGCFREKTHPSSEPDGACCMLGAAMQCYGSPPVVLITVHDKGMCWSGRREESRGDPRCLVCGEGNTLNVRLFGRNYKYYL